MVGNTVIVKPSEQAPLVVRRLVELLDLPEGVLAPLSGQGATGAALVAHPGTDLVTHVGSSRTGREIAAVCASTMKTAVLELGGKDALIIDRDVDPVWAAKQAASGAFANAGQICTAVERILVHEALAEPFLEALVERARGLRMGPGTDPDTQLGPLVGPELREKVHEQVRAAVAQGARRLCGGEIPAGPGFFYPATVLSDCHESMAIMAEETFGPVAPVRIVSSFEEALDRANDSTYGLSATVLSANQAHIQQAVVELDVATVKVNAVWGGAPGGAASPRRGSGQGFGYGPELLDEVTQTKVIHIEASPS